MRIYIPGSLRAREQVDITGDNLHYLKNVMRMNKGAQLNILTDDELLVAGIILADKKTFQAEVRSRRDLIPPRYQFIVYQCVLKREYMDTVVEKYTELGVTRIVPVISGRTVGTVKENTLARYKEIAKNAALQSEQEFIPEIENKLNLRDIQANCADNIVFFERGKVEGFPAIKTREVSIVIGPEGGFTDEEVSVLARKGFTVATPLKSILKAETAAVVFAGAVRMQL